MDSQHFLSPDWKIVIELCAAEQAFQCVFKRDILVLQSNTVAMMFG
jgi:hypothetical protein